MPISLLDQLIFLRQNVFIRLLLTPRSTAAGTYRSLGMLFLVCFYLSRAAYKLFYDSISWVLCHCGVILSGVDTAPIRCRRISISQTVSVAHFIRFRRQQHSCFHASLFDRTEPPVPFGLFCGSIHLLLVRRSTLRIQTRVQVFAADFCLDVSHVRVVGLLNGKCSTMCQRTCEPFLSLRFQLEVPQSAAVPSPPAARVDSGSELLARTEEPVDDVTVKYLPSWAGAFLSGADNTFDEVVGTITVPTTNDNINIWVGLDGMNCANTLFATGVGITVKNGQASYYIFYALDHSMYLYSETMAIKVGDSLTFGVQATSSTSGTAWIENLTTKKMVKQTITASQVPRGFCRNSADWILANYDTAHALANFGKVTFTGAQAHGPRGTYSPRGATHVVMEENNKAVTSTTIRRDQITIKRL